MLEAAIWSLIAGSSLFLGGVLSLALPLGDRTVGLLMGFGSGVLISAVAYELVGDAFDTSEGSVWVAVGLAVGAFTFYAGDSYIAHRGGGARKELGVTHGVEQQQAVILGTVLDGIPEGIVLGMSLIGGGGGSVAIIAAVFLSNLPEAIGGTTGLAGGGMSRTRILGMWFGIMVLTVAASMIGFGLFDTASAEAVAFTQAFAGGALLTMLADTMMPEAFEKGGRAAGLLTVLGFAISFGLTQAG